MYFMMMRLILTLFDRYGKYEEEVPSDVWALAVPKFQAVRIKAAPTDKGMSKRTLGFKGR